MKIDKKALEAAYDKFWIGGSWKKDNFVRVVQAAIDEAGLVEQGRQLAALREAAGRVIAANKHEAVGRDGRMQLTKQKLGAEHELIDCLTDTARHIEALAKADEIAEELGKQLAVLREALHNTQEDVCGILCQSVWESGETQRHSRKCKAITAALTDTDEAAALYRRVPEGWQIVPLKLDDEMILAGLAPGQDCHATVLTGESLKIRWRSMLAAAPAAKPQAGEGTG
jgi:hypothetical protein